VPTVRQWAQYDRDQADSAVLHRAATFLREDPTRARYTELSCDADATALAALLDVLAAEIAHLDSGGRWQAVESIETANSTGRVSSRPRSRSSSRSTTSRAISVPTPPDVTAVPFTEVFHALGMRQPDTATIGTSTRWRLWAFPCARSPGAWPGSQPLRGALTGARFARRVRRGADELPGSERAKNSAFARMYSELVGHRPYPARPGAA
jgi:hypothetical protein